SLEKGNNRRCLLVVVDLGVGEPGVVVDDRVHDVDAIAVLAVLASTVAGDPVAGPLEAGVLAGVHVQEVTGAGPLVAVGRFPRRPGWREIPARLSTFQTVEWQKPVAPATRRGPQPVLRRHSQI